jgi:hypothetical protein
MLWGNPPTSVLPSRLAQRLGLVSDAFLLDGAGGGGKERQTLPYYTVCPPSSFPHLIVTRYRTG